MDKSFFSTYKTQLAYIVPFLAYILPAFFISKPEISYPIRIFLAAFFLFLFRKNYSIKLRFNAIAILIGLLIFLEWIVFTFSISSQEFNPIALNLTFKLIGFIIIAPVIEELFTRDFLVRQTISVEKNKKIENIPQGKYTPISFAISVLFFGFSHSMITAGIVSAVLFNILLYRNKSIGDCITAHATANILLSIYILITKSWLLW